MNPAADMLLAMVREAERVAKANLQHNNPAYIAGEAKRLADYQDGEDTRQQLAKYGVNL